MRKKQHSASEVDEIRNGMRCEVTAGTHVGKGGVIEDRKVSASGHVTITVRTPDGDRFKTLARNVRSPAAVRRC